MSNKEILEKAIAKAIKGGWTDGEKYRKEMSKAVVVPMYYVRSFVFDKDFAKALWGDPWAFFAVGRSGDTIGGNFINYLGHLANMVVADDPIKYLGDNI